MWYYVKKLWILIKFCPLAAHSDTIVAGEGGAAQLLSCGRKIPGSPPWLSLTLGEGRNPCYCMMRVGFRIPAKPLLITPWLGWERIPCCCSSLCFHQHCKGSVFLPLSSCENPDISLGFALSNPRGVRGEGTSYYH